MSNERLGITGNSTAFSLCIDSTLACCGLFSTIICTSVGLFSIGIPGKTSSKLTTNFPFSKKVHLKIFETIAAICLGLNICRYSQCDDSGRETKRKRMPAEIWLITVHSLTSSYVTWWQVMGKTVQIKAWCRQSFGIDSSVTSKKMQIFWQTLTVKNQFYLLVDYHVSDNWQWVKGSHTPLPPPWQTYIWYLLSTLLWRKWMQFTMESNPSNNDQWDLNQST